MTNEEAIRWLDAIKKYYIHGGDEAYDKKRMKAIDKAIKALEQLQDVHDTCKNCIEFSEFKQQPSEDCISRQAVLDVINFEDKWLFDANGHNANTHIAFNGLESRVKALPSVTPKYTDEEIDKAQAVEQAYVDKMVELAVEETKRPKGKWIEVLEHRDEFGSTWHYECSECRGRSYKGFEPLERYCPNCGAEMEDAE